MEEIVIKIKKGPNERQKEILKEVVNYYLKKGEPISSDKINKRGHFNFSPATIRIELSKLEENGFVYHPHTSAGCLPTDYGLQYFVDYLMEEDNVSLEEQEKLFNQLTMSNAPTHFSDLIREIVRLIADHTNSLSLGFLPNGLFYYSGLINILENEKASRKEIIEILKLIENINDYTNLLPRKIKYFKIYIGQENPLLKIENHSMIFARYELINWGGKGLIGLIAPKQTIHYSKFKPLISLFISYLNNNYLNN